jgi:hypothetical protein
VECVQCQLTRKELCPKCNNERSGKVKALLYPIAIITLTAVGVHLATLNDELIKMVPMR